MEAWQLPVELQEVERALAGRPLGRPSADLREKVLGGVRRVRRERGQARWRFAAATAAGVLLWLNLSLSATRATDYGLHLGGPGGSLEGASRQIQRLVPELSPQESRRQAILLRAGAALVPCADLSAPPRLINFF